MTQKQDILICEETLVCSFCKKNHIPDKTFHCENPACRQSAIDWFMERVEKRSDDTECWDWLGGYASGLPLYNKKHSFRTSAARVAKTLFEGASIDKVQMQRTCPNDRCVNPAHWLGDWERFENYMMPMIDGCIYWLGTLDKDGRAVGTLNGKKGFVTRILWEKFFGEIPEGLCCCHKCDNPYCVNIWSHIFIGTQKENIHDMLAKGRWRPAGWTMPPESVLRGEDSPNAKLTEAMIKEARLLAESGLKHEAIASKFGVSRRSIGRALSGERWAHLQTKPGAELAPGSE